jgi:hypothetical protein
VFETIEQARRFAFDLLDDYKATTPVVAPLRPVIRVNRRFGQRTYGRYYYRHHLGKLIELAPRMELHTLVHELAHYLTDVIHEDRGHGTTFKRVLADLATRTLRIQGVEASAPEPIRHEVVTLPAAGTEVMVDDGRGKLFLGTVIKRNRVRCKVRDEAGVVWNVPAHMMTSD